MEIQPSDWISHKEMFARKHREEPKIDPDVSHVLGQPVSVNDPRLMKVVIEWKKKMSLDTEGTAQYNFLQQSGFINDLREAFNVKA
jgi:hypothetical protein